MVADFSGANPVAMLSRALRRTGVAVCCVYVTGCGGHLAHQTGEDADVENDSLVDGSAADGATTLDAETEQGLDASLLPDIATSSDGGTPADTGTSPDSATSYCPQTDKYYQEWVEVVASGNYMVCNTLDCQPQDCCYVPVPQEVNACVPR